MGLSQGVQVAGDERWGYPRGCRSLSPRSSPGLLQSRRTRLKASRGRVDMVGSLGRPTAGPCRFVPLYVLGASAGSSRAGAFRGAATAQVVMCPGSAPDAVQQDKVTFSGAQTDLGRRLAELRQSPVPGCRCRLASSLASFRPGVTTRRGSLAGDSGCYFSVSGDGAELKGVVGVSIVTARTPMCVAVVIRPLSSPQPLPVRRSCPGRLSGKGRQRDIICAIGGIIGVIGA